MTGFVKGPVFAATALAVLLLTGCQRRVSQDAGESPNARQRQGSNGRRPPKEEVLKYLQAAIVSPANTVRIWGGGGLILTLDPAERRDLASLFARAWPTARGYPKTEERSETVDTSRWLTPTFWIDIDRGKVENVPRDRPPLIVQLLVFTASAEPEGDVDVEQILCSQLTIYDPEHVDDSWLFEFRDDLIPRWLWAKGDHSYHNYKLVPAAPRK